jgi:soluble lytic murein transglycosylase
MYPTAEEIAKKSNIEINENIILEPDTNINLGTKYIAMLIQKYNCIELALAAYNAGSGNVDSWIENGTLKEDGSNIENIPYKETNNYVRKILKNYEMYKELYND